MKRYIKSSSDTSKSLEEYVGLPFDLSDDEVMWRVSEWTVEQFMEAIQKSKRYKKRESWVDDVSWNSNRIYFAVMEGPDQKIGEFNARLNWYDVDSDEYEDVEYLIKDTIKDWVN